MNNNEIKLDADQTSGSHIKRSVLFWISTLMSCGSLVLVFTFLWLLVPSCAEMFADFEVELPKLTSVLVDISEFISTYLLLSLLPISGLFACIVWGLSALDKRDKKISMLVTGMVSLVPPVIIIYILYLPTFCLCQCY